MGCTPIHKEKMRKKMTHRMVGKRFGRLIVISFSHPTKNAKYCWNCKCDCGAIKTVVTGDLTSGKTLSCGCYKKERTHEANSIDITGKRFGRLVGVKPIGTSYDGIDWDCQCDCGNKCIVSVHRLMSGNTKSCGCYKSDRIHETKVVPMLGKRFGRLVVIEECGSDEQGGIKWKCRCECGNTIIAPGRDLRYGNGTSKYISCGCFQKEVARKNVQDPTLVAIRRMSNQIKGMERRGELVQ